MTLPDMESSEMPQEIESNEVHQTVESVEKQEAAAQLEQATFEPEAVIETEGSYEESESVETAFTEVMKAVEVPAEMQEGTDPPEEGNQDQTEDTPILQSTLQVQQQKEQMLSNISKLMKRVESSVIRKAG